MRIPGIGVIKRLAAKSREYPVDHLPPVPLPPVISMKAKRAAKSTKRAADSG